MKERQGQKVERLTRELFKTRRELRRVRDELNEIIRDVKSFLSPPNGECGDENFYALRICHEKEGMDCPFIMCKKWFENSEYMNCERYLQSEARNKGGLSVEELATIQNLFPEEEYGLDAASIKGIEIRAVGKLAGSILELAKGRGIPIDGPYTPYVAVLFGNLDSRGWENLAKRVQDMQDSGLSKLVEEHSQIKEEQNGRGRLKRRRYFGSEGTAPANKQGIGNE